MNITNEAKKAQLEELAALYSELLHAKRNAEGDLHTNFLEAVFLTMVDAILGSVASPKEIISTIVKTTEAFIKEELSSGKDAGENEEAIEEQNFEIHLIKSDGSVIVNRLVYKGLSQIDEKRAIKDAINCCFKESGESDFHAFMKGIIGAALVKPACSVQR